MLHFPLNYSLLQNGGTAGSGDTAVAEAVVPFGGLAGQLQAVAGASATKRLMTYLSRVMALMTSSCFWSKAPAPIPAPLTAASCIVEP